MGEGEDWLINIPGIDVSDMAEGCERGALLMMANATAALADGILEGSSSKSRTKIGELKT